MNPGEDNITPAMDEVTNVTKVYHDGAWLNYNLTF